MDIYRAFMLSQRSVGGVKRGTPMSRRRKESHVSLAAVDAMERYAASKLDLATIDCFLTL